jgi:hypothetical protein
LAANQPLAVAFVEVRPEVEDFRTNAEDQLRSDLADDAIPVRGEFQLGGLDRARADVDALAQQTQQAVADLASATTPDFAQGFVAGAQEAISSAIELADTTETVNENLITAEAARRAFAAANAQAAVSETALAATTRAETRATIEATAADNELFRVRSRRASSVGPLRLAGIGLGAGVAIFTATQALRELSEELEVTGDEAGTTEGKLRNFGSNLLTGDLVGAFKGLTDETNTYSTAQLGAIATTEGLADALERMGEGADIARSQLESVERLTSVPQFLQTRVAGAQASGDSGAELAALQQAQTELEKQEKLVRQLGLDQTQLNIALEAIFRERKGIADQIESVTSQARPDILKPLVEAVTDAELTGDTSAIIAALRDEATALNRAINAVDTNAEDRQRFKEQLVQVNQRIESIQDEIIAEEQRHKEAMLDKLLDVGVLEDLEAQVAGGDGGAGRAARAAAIERTLARGTIDGKKLTREEKEQLNEELISINEEIESEQDAIVAEQERHAAEMIRKQEESDRAFVQGLSNQTRGANRRQLVAQETARLSDDIRVSEELQRIYAGQIEAARKNIRDKELRDSTIAGLEEQLFAEERSERSLRQQQRTQALERREESLDLDVQLAAAQDNERKEIRAHEAKIRYLTERIRHTREGTNQRKALRVQIAQERAEIKRLQEEIKKENEEDEGGSFDQIAASFLTELQGFSATFGSNLLGQQLPQGTSTTQAPTDFFAGQRERPPQTSPTVFEVPSPFEAGRGSGTRSQADVAAELRDSRGAPVSQSQGNDLIAISRETNVLLRRIAQGVGHTEARASRKLADNSVETSQD